MIQPRCDLDLAQEPVLADRGDQRLLHQLDGDVAIVFDVLRKIDSRHPAAADFAKDAVAAEDGRDRLALFEGDRVAGQTPSVDVSIRLRATRFGGAGWCGMQNSIQSVACLLVF